MTGALNGREGRATIHDVAKAAGVSISTVSRVLSGARRVDPGLAESVWKASSRLGYRVDPIGRALRRRETATVGLVVPNITNPFFPVFVQGVEAALRESGSSLLLADSQDSVDVERSCIELMIDRRVDALVISPCHRLASEPAIADAMRRVRVVQVDRRASSIVPHVGVDHDAAIRELLDALQKRGRRSFAFICGDTSEWPTFRRLSAFKKWTKVNDPQALNHILTGVGDMGAADREVRLLVEQSPQIDAVICSNDVLAVGALAGLEGLRIPVPKKIAVTGYDDTIIARITKPTLTSVSQPVEELARLAVQLAGSSHEQTDAYMSKLPAQIHYRNST
jgi:LacI family transcriptional regulator